MYDGSKWKAKVKGLVRAIEAKGFKYALFTKKDMTIAVMARAKGKDLSKKVFTRGVAQRNITSDEFCPAVGRYFALQRAFQAAMRRKNDEIVLINDVISSPMGKNYEYKSQFRVQLTKDEMTAMKKKFTPRKVVPAEV